MLGEDRSWKIVSLPNSKALLIRLLLAHTRSWHAANLTLAAGKLKGDALCVVIDLLHGLDFQALGDDHRTRE